MKTYTFEYALNRDYENRRSDCITAETFLQAYDRIMQHLENMYCDTKGLLLIEITCIRLTAVETKIILK